MKVVFLGSSANSGWTWLIIPSKESCFKTRKDMCESQKRSDFVGYSQHLGLNNLQRQ